MYFLYFFSQLTKTMILLTWFESFVILSFLINVIEVFVSN